MKLSRTKVVHFSKQIETTILRIAVHVFIKICYHNSFPGLHKAYDHFKQFILMQQYVSATYMYLMLKYASETYLLFLYLSSHTCSPDLLYQSPEHSLLCSA